MKSISQPLIIALFLIDSFAVFAQKLPKVQSVSVRAPVNIKVDGKPTEWDKFQAYNSGIGIFYTIANDDERLYFTLQAKDPEVINKIVGGGVTFTIQHATDKNDKDKMSIVYPVRDNKNAPISFILGDPKGFIDTTNKTADSIMILHNNILAQKCKWIGVKGIDGVDTLISVYNEDGIKAAGQFNSKKIYTLEMSVLLKHAKLLINDAVKFKYNIQTNGIKADDASHAVIEGSAKFKQQMLQSLAEQDARQSTASDFWGEYTLARK